MTATLLRAATTDQVLGAFYSVYRAMGFGFLETPYANALAVELGKRNLSVRREVPVQILYEGVVVGSYRYDLLVEECVLVEVKSASTLCQADERQLLNYLRASNIEVGLLLNFGPNPQHKRVIATNNRWSA